MSEVLLVNPRRRRRKMSAKQAKYFGGGRKRRANPRRKRRASSRRRRRNPGFALPSFINPRRRRKSRRRGRMSNPRRRRRSGYRRNPIGLKGLSVRGIQGQVMGAIPGAFGALALDVAYGYLPIPATWKNGYVGYVVKGLAAIALGMIAAKVVKGHTAAKMTEGALTVMLHGIMRGAVVQYAPQVQLGDADDGAGWNPSVPFGESGMNAYLPNMSANASGGEYLAPNMGAYMYADHEGM